MRLRTAGPVGPEREDRAIDDFFRPFPKYLQVRDVLLRRLERDFQPGQRFPTEQELCTEFGVSRETVREALRVLVHDGLISRHAGRGSFVLRKPAGRVEPRLTGLVEDFSDLKLDTHAAVLERAEVPAPHDVAETVGTALGELLFRIGRLRSFEGHPLAFHEAYLPVEIGRRIASLDLRHTSIIREIATRLRIPFREEFHRVEAVAADTAMARLLDVPIGAPLLYVTRLLLTDKGALVALFRSQFRADRYFYTVDLSGQRSRSGRAARTRPRRRGKPAL